MLVYGLLRDTAVNDDSSYTHPGMTVLRDIQWNLWHETWGRQSESTCTGLRTVTLSSDLTNKSTSELGTVFHIILVIFY